jgi:2,4-dienoyl-CoA reductase-like NADH-dependent reductase (Old Yellow Enzyme family)/NADPH-dependent 2,4-dienoyl-CoA reductase/sulfur reductase-like enzyme
MKYEKLFQPLQVNGVTLKNRIIASPTSMSGFDSNGYYNEETYNYFRMKAVGGAAMVIVGEVMVDLENGRSHPVQCGIDDPAAMIPLRNLANAIHEGGALASVELDHGGCLSGPEFLHGRNAKGPSSFTDEWGDTCDEMTEEDILHAADMYAQAALNAKTYGFDMVMLHAGHGWLIHQFISPITNKRTDKWGGSLENRLRFLNLVVEKVRAAVGPRFPIDIRISGSERIEGGYGIETGIEIAKAVDGKVDLIHVSAGTQEVPYSAILMHPGIFQKPGENSGLAAEIKKYVKTPVCTVGAFSDPAFMEQYMEETGVDCIAMGRQLIADPFFPRKLMQGKEREITPCLRCTECLSGLIHNQRIHCSVNPIIGREDQFFQPRPVNNPGRKVLIAGGGPGGMEAALEADKRGHKVVLCESTGRLGGTLRFADAGGFKTLMRNYRDSQIDKIGRSGVEVRLNTPVTKEIVDEIRPDVLIIAVGSHPFFLPIPGAQGENVVAGADLLGHEKAGHNVVVIGGGLVGCEEALQLADKGYHVTIVEMQEELAPDCGRMHRLGLLHEVEVRENIDVCTGVRCTGITDTAVTAVDADGAEQSYPSDWVVMAAGMRPNSDTVDELRRLVPESYVIGDCHTAATVLKAVREGYDAAVNIGL